MSNTSTSSVRAKNKLIPELRFPEFSNIGEWVEKTLKDLASIKRGAASQHLNYVKESHPNAVRLLRINDFLNNQAVFVEDTEDMKRFRVKKDDILIAGTGATAGITFLVPRKFHKLSYSYNAPRIRVNEANIFFVYYYLNSDSILVQQKQMFVGNAQPFIDTKAIGNFHLAIPESPLEQQKIASCLSSLDELIAANNDKLEALKDHKKGLMQNLFPQEGEKVPNYRFPEFEKDGVWAERPLIEIADKNVKWSFIGGPFGSNLKASDYTSTGIRIIQLQNIGDGEFYDDYKIYTSVEKADELLSCNIYAGDIILSKMGDPVGRACLIPEHLERCVMASDGIRLVVDEKNYSKYLIYSLINSKQIREAIDRKATGSTRKRIGLSDLKEVQLTLPKNEKEQQKIASCLSALDELITAQSEKIEQLQQHKKGLMQGLFPKPSESGFTGW